MPPAKAKSAGATVAFDGTFNVADPYAALPPAEQAGLRPIAGLVHGICDGIPDFMAFTVTVILKHASFFSSQFAGCSSMTSL
jgi:hypothetical protein